MMALLRIHQNAFAVFAAGNGDQGTYAAQPLNGAIGSGDFQHQPPTIATNNDQQEPQAGHRCSDAAAAPAQQQNDTEQTPNPSIVCQEHQSDQSMIEQHLRQTSSQQLGFFSTPEAAPRPDDDDHQSKTTSPLTSKATSTFSSIEADCRYTLRSMS